MPMAVLNPSLAPSINASYTLTLRMDACIMNQQMTPKRMTAAMRADREESVSSGRCFARTSSSTMSEVNAKSTPKTTLSQILIFCAAQHASSPPSVAKYVAMRSGRKMSAGLAAPSCARYAMIVVGMIVSPLAPSTTNMIMALEALVLSALSDCSSDMALSPMGVAALSSPSMLAAKFMNMVP